MKSEGVALSDQKWIQEMVAKFVKEECIEKVSIRSVVIMLL